VSPLLVAALVAVAVLVAWPPSTTLTMRVHDEVLPRRGRARRRRAAELEWLEAVVAELSAGRDPGAALVSAAALGDALQVCPRATAAARAGADVVPALRADGTRSAAVRAAAACWDVAASTGAGLAASLTVLADSLRETERVRAELVAGLAEPRATAVVLACLPALGLALGSLLGAEPVQWLTGSSWGLAVLAGGLALELVGCLWSWRIARRLEAGL
jgi:tight adherence protein B